MTSPRSATTVPLSLRSPRFKTPWRGILGAGTGQGGEAPPTRQLKFSFEIPTQVTARGQGVPIRSLKNLESPASHGVAAVLDRS